MGNATLNDFFETWMRHVQSNNLRCNWCGAPLETVCSYCGTNHPGAPNVEPEPEPATEKGKKGKRSKAPVPTTIIGPH